MTSQIGSILDMYFATYRRQQAIRNNCLESNLSLCTKFRRKLFITRINYCANENGSFYRHQKCLPFLPKEDGPF
jgi:hypothetical protein